MLCAAAVINRAGWRTPWRTSLPQSRPTPPPPSASTAERCCWSGWASQQQPWRTTMQPLPWTPGTLATSSHGGCARAPWGSTRQQRRTSQGGSAVGLDAGWLHTRTHAGTYPPPMRLCAGPIQRVPPPPPSALALPALPVVACELAGRRPTKQAGVLAHVNDAPSLPYSPHHHHHHYLPTLASPGVPACLPACPLRPG